MNIFDRTLVEFLLKHFNRSYYVFRTIVFIADNDDLIKGGVFGILCWYLWFRSENKNSEKRVLLISTLIAVLFSMVVALTLAGIMPFRVRPFLNPQFVFSSADLLDPYLSQKSSFPSDHAALFISLATGFFFISRKAGLFSLSYAVIFILFPRFYLGYHYPSDLIIGGLIGVAFAIFFNRSAVTKKMIREIIIPVSLSRPALFYPIFFVITYEISDLFSGSRSILLFLHEIYRHYRASGI